MQPKEAAGAPRPADQGDLIRRQAFYCAPHAQVPGALCLSSHLLRFEPEPKSKTVRKCGADEHTICLEARDVLECGTVAMSQKDSKEATHYLQLKVRTLDGVKVCAPRDSNGGGCVVFWMRQRELHEVAALLRECAELSERDRAPVEQRSLTSIPFSCLEYVKEFEAASYSFLWHHPLVPKESATAGNPAAPEAVVNKIALQPGDTSHPMLTQSLAQLLNWHLPVSLRLPGAVEWVLRYTPKTHGVSMPTLFRNVQDLDKTVLLVRDSDDHMFGGFAPEAWHIDHQFYGSGEAFVFSFGRASLGEELSQLQVHTWTARNACFMYSDNEFLAMGGGDGQHALVIQSDLLRGCSAPTETFGNPPLAGSTDFVVRDLEVWALEAVKW